MEDGMNTTFPTKLINVVAGVHGMLMMGESAAHGCVRPQLHR